MKNVCKELIKEGQREKSYTNVIDEVILIKKMI
jgi:hypothetical protein